MLSEFEAHVKQRGLFGKKNRLLLAISGGIDSVVLAHLLKGSGYNFALAHCNFKLRGKDSKADETFCKELARSLGVKIFTESFNTENYAEEHKLSIQLAARELRYHWFDTLVSEEGFDYLLTAHHANDVIETVLINLLRGTGIKGMRGISEKKEKLVRPLLIFKKKDLEAFAKKEKIRFREDKSNAEDKYERNFIRRQIIPSFQKLNPQLEETFLRNTSHFRQEAAIVADHLETREAELVLRTHDCIFINKKKLKKEKHMESLLHYMIEGYGFNTTQQRNILRNLSTDALPGKIFSSDSHILTIDRNDLVIKERSLPAFTETRFNSLKELKNSEFFKVSVIKKFFVPAASELIIEPERLVYPLTVRIQTSGDKLRPFGMKGFKLVSDIMREQKLNSFQKEACKVLVNGNGEIIWLIGYRSDERYKVNAGSGSFLKISIRNGR